MERFTSALQLAHPRTSEQFNATEVEHIRLTQSLRKDATKTFRN
jgi:hypothetical protein